jgi:hypothetical protein
MIHKDAPPPEGKDTPEPDRPARSEPPTTPDAPVVIEYPKMLYHADSATITVQNADEEKKAKAEGFTETPGAPAEKDDKDDKEPRGTRR